MREKTVRYRELMQCLGYKEKPLVAYYSNDKPPNSIGPRNGLNISIISLSSIFSLATHFWRINTLKKKRFRCMMQYVAQTRERGIPSVFSAEHYGCPGFRFYAGFSPKLPAFNHHFISTGIPGMYPGERFVPSVASARKLGAALEGRSPEGEWLIFDQFRDTIREHMIKSIMFFANPEIITGLIGLVRFASDRDDAVQVIYASGCASLFTWPVQYTLQGREQAVLGIFDLAARPWLKNGELTLSMPYSLFEKILHTFKDSFMFKQKRCKGKPEMMFGWQHALCRADDFDKRMGTK